MRRPAHRTSRLGARGALLLAASALLLTPASALAKSTEPASIWKVEPTVNPAAEDVTNSELAGVSASGVDEAWTVGFFADEKAVASPLVEHWNGSAWTQVPVQEPPEEQVKLNGVDDLAPNDAWAVGERFPDGEDFAVPSSSRTLIEHWNGTAWSIVPSPSPATGVGDSDVLRAISGTGPDDLWAAGYALNEEEHRVELVFEHWNGREWSLASSPTDALEANEPVQLATAITAISPDDVWAVGIEATNIKQETLSAHWNGTEWSLVPTPNVTKPGDVENQLTGVSAAGANHVWASGYASNVKGENKLLPYVLSWNGTSWTLTKTPNKGSEGSRLNAIQALSPSDVWTVGQTQENNGDIDTLTDQFNGSSWKIVTSPQPGWKLFGGGALDAVTSAGGESLFAAGTDHIKDQCCLRSLAIGTTQG
jgi:hypothetical protein